MIPLKPKATLVTLKDDILWAVVRKSWFGGGVVDSVWASKHEADTWVAELKAMNGKTYVTQRAPFRMVGYGSTRRGTK